MVSQGEVICFLASFVPKSRRWKKLNYQAKKTTPRLWAQGFSEMIRNYGSLLVPFSFLGPAAKHLELAMGSLVIPSAFSRSLPFRAGSLHSCAQLRLCRHRTP